MSGALVAGGLAVDNPHDAVLDVRGVNVLPTKFSVQYRTPPLDLTGIRTCWSGESPRDDRDEREPAKVFIHKPLPIAAR